MNDKFKKFWVCSVNNYIVGASYDGKKLKDRHVIPSFRKFHFIREENDLAYFSKRDEINNFDLVKKLLENSLQPQEK